MFGNKSKKGKNGFMNMEAMECELIAAEKADREETLITSLDDLVEPEDDAETVAAKEDAEERLMKRKKCELELIKKYDRTKINTAKECWFLMDSKWLNEWSSFVNDPDEDEPPGVVSTYKLLQEDKKTPLSGLKTPIDYRAVTPLVYHMFVNMYGKDESPELPRYLIDIYKIAVPIDKLAKIKMSALHDAQVKVNKIRTQWMHWGHKYADDEEEKDPSCCCGWVTKEHLEAFIYWAITCWSRKKSGRSKIKYRDYQPLRGDNLIDGEMDTVVGLDDLSAHSDVSTRSDISNISTGSNKSTGSTKSLKEKREEFIVDLDDGMDHSEHADKDYERGQWVNRFYGQA